MRNSASGSQQLQGQVATALKPSLAGLEDSAACGGGLCWQADRVTAKVPLEAWEVDWLHNCSFLS